MYSSLYIWFDGNMYFFGFLDWIIVFCIFVMGNSLVWGVDKMYDGFWYNLYNDCVCYLYYLLFC